MARYGKEQAVPESSASQEEEFHPEVRLEQLLMEARQEFLRSGEPMLDWDGLEREIAGRRGGVSEED